MTNDARQAARTLAMSGPAARALAKLEPIDWAAWSAAAGRLSRDLAGAPDLDRRIHHFYLPVLFFFAAEVRRAASRPVFIGIQAPQGAGKTTLTGHLLALAPDLGLRGVALSIDDFYLTRDEQLRLAAAHPGNPYLEHRGYPGTHDIGLGIETLTALRRLGPGSDIETIRVPFYDKSAHGGRGDRAPMSMWPAVTGPLDFVLLEGWMLGFVPVAADRLDDPFLEAPNRALAAYDRWHGLLDAFVVLRAQDPLFVMRWRVEAEAAMKARGSPGLDRAAIEDYVRRFLPAYALYRGAPSRFSSDQTLTLVLDDKRRPVAE